MSASRLFVRLALAAAPAVAAAALAPAGWASGGSYVLKGGTQAERSQVVAALNASAFPWSIVPGPVVVQIVRGVGGSSSTAGRIVLDAGLLDSGRFSWGVVQHEYAHQVDYALLTDAMRAQLHALLGGASWWGPGSHAQLDCERFADEVAWSYWVSPDNAMKPQGAQDEGGQVAPAAFRSALAALLPALAPTASR